MKQRHFDAIARYAAARRPVFDNSALHPKDELSADWNWFLDYKFSYLSLLGDDPNNAERALRERFSQRGCPEFHTFLGMWREDWQKERGTYLFRISQLPVLTVHKEWYTQEIPAVVEWCDREQKYLHSLDLQVTDSQSQIDAVLGPFGSEPNPAIPFEGDRLLQIASFNALAEIGKRLEALETSLIKPKGDRKGLTDAVTASAEEIGQAITLSNAVQSEEYVCSSSLSQSFMRKLCVSLVTALLDQFDERALIEEFLIKLRDEVGCEVCDFLEVKEADGEPVLSWRAATVTASDLSAEYEKMDEDSLRSTIQSRESYKRGEGITGSILLLSHPSLRDLWCHIGSNDVLSDPRQSKDHLGVYEDQMYPKVLRDKHIRNFWEFPVWRKEQMYGVVRVVNKLSADRMSLQAAGWSYLTRVQVALIIRWFSAFLEAASDRLADKEDFAASRKRQRMISHTNETLELSWIHPTFLSKVYRHLFSDLRKREEHRDTGCCIITLSCSTTGPALPELRPYPLINSVPGSFHDLEELNPYHDAVNPLLGGFVFDHTGRFRRLVRFKEPGTSGGEGGYETLLQLTEQRKQCVVFLLERGTRDVRILMNGRQAANVYLGAKSGDLIFRFTSHLLEYLKNTLEFTASEGVLEDVVATALRLSTQGNGGLFVIGPVPPDTLVFDPPRIELKLGSYKVADIGVEALAEFAKMDGATFIEQDGTVTRVNSVVTPYRGAVTMKFIAIGEEETGSEYGGTIGRGRGSRHAAVHRIVSAAPSLAVIVISEDGGISILRGQKGQPF